MPAQHMRNAFRARPSGMYMRQSSAAPKLSASFQSVILRARNPACPAALSARSAHARSAHARSAHPRSAHARLAHARARPTRALGPRALGPRALGPRALGPHLLRSLRLVDERHPPKDVPCANGGPTAAAATAAAAVGSKALDTLAKNVVAKVTRDDRGGGRDRKLKPATWRNAASAYYQTCEG